MSSQHAGIYPVWGDPYRRTVEIRQPWSRVPSSWDGSISREIRASDGKALAPVVRKSAISDGVASLIEVSRNRCMVASRRA